MGSVIPQHDQINGTPGHIYGHCSRRIQRYMFYEATKVSSTQHFKPQAELQDKFTDIVAGVSMFCEATMVSCSTQNIQPQAEFQDKSTDFIVGIIHGLRGNKGQFYAALRSSAELQDKSRNFVAGVSMFSWHQNSVLRSTIKFSGTVGHFHELTVLLCEFLRRPSPEF